jgi:hypothetical protein
MSSMVQIKQAQAIIRWGGIGTMPSRQNAEEAIATLQEFKLDVQPLRDLCAGVLTEQEKFKKLDASLSKIIEQMEKAAETHTDSGSAPTAGQ